MLIRWIVLTAVFFATVVLGQNPVLESYIQEGLKNNLALKQKEFSCERSMSALKEARGLFLPSVGIEARYSRAGGGRIIDIPIGDLMNPVYGTLNTLLQGAGYPSMFPANLQNESIPFLRKEEHDTKVRLIQPVFQPAIAYNYHIKSSLRELERASRNVFARQLVSDIQTAYYNYFKTIRVTALLDTTEQLLQEHLRVTKRLAENGKANQAAVYRASAEFQAFLRQKAEAGKNRSMALSYFNFLLNRPLDSPVDLSETSPDSMGVPSFESGERQAIQNRDEFRQLQAAVSILKSKTGLSRAAFLPGISAVLDYGYQGEQYRFKPEDDYWMASLVASWNLFSGFQNLYQIQQAQLERKEAETKLEEVHSQIRLEVLEAHQNLLVAVQLVEAAEAMEKSARKSYESAERLYCEGMTPQIEFIDARNTLTSAETQAIVSRYDYFIRWAEYEKVTAAFPLGW